MHQARPRSAHTRAPGGAEYRAYAAGATAILLLVAVPAYSRVSARLSRNHLIVGTTAFFTTHAGVLRLWQRDGDEFVLCRRVLLWIAIFNMMIVAQFGHLRMICTPKKLADGSFRSSASVCRSGGCWCRGSPNCDRRCWSDADDAGRRRRPGHFRGSVSGDSRARSQGAGQLQRGWPRRQ